jgi:hypothetical protein
MDRDEALFVNLVMIFKSAAMQQMGKVVNPLTGKVERNLEQARFSIDTIAMLKDKTSGNLSEDLNKLLDSVLLELRMNFVEETKVGDTPPAPQEPAEANSGAASGAGEGAGSDEAPGGTKDGPDPGQGGAKNG